MTDDLERLAAACILPGFAGLEPPAWIRSRLERGLGGVVLFAGNVCDAEQVAALTAALRAVRPELLVAIDEEGGDVTRLEARTGSSYPGNLALGAVDDVVLTAEVASALAGDLARAGVNLNLAPVADASTNPANPIVGVRAFGSDPELVARHVAAFVSGTQRHRVAACAKHFPGHGDTMHDSHLELPVVEGGIEDALIPFRAAIGAGVRAIMTGHLLVRSLDDAPATLSPAVVSGLLRGELGFDGLVISDALDMRGVSAGVEEAAVRALAAGVDALCLGPDSSDDEVARVQAALAAAVRGGRLPLERVAEAASRVESTGRWASAPSPEGAADRSIGAAAARRAVEADGDVAVAGAPFAVELAPEPSIAAGEAGFTFGDAVRARRPDAAVVTLRERDALPALDGDRGLVLVLRDAHRHPWQQAIVRELLALHPDAVVVETGLPAWRPEGAAGYLVTYGAARVNAEAAVELLSR